MRTTSRMMLVLAALLALSTAALAVDQLVNVYVGGKRVEMNPSARVRNGVTYGPLRASAEAVGAHVEWDARARTATICTDTRCVPIKQSQGIMVGSSMMIPVRLMGEAIGREVKWDPAAKAVRIQ